MNKKKRNDNVEEILEIVIQKESKWIGNKLDKILVSATVVEANDGRVVFEDSDNNIIVWKASNYNKSSYYPGNKLNLNVKIKELTEENGKKVTVVNYVI